MKGHHFRIMIYQQYAGCTGMTNLILAWAVSLCYTATDFNPNRFLWNSLMGCSTLAFGSSICSTIQAIPGQCGIYVCSNDILVCNLFEGNDILRMWELTKLITMEVCRLSVLSHFLASKTFHHGALGPTRPDANVIRKWKLGASGRALHSDWYDFELDPRRSNSLHWREISILKKVFKLLYVDLIDVDMGWRISEKVSRLTMFDPTCVFSRNKKL